MTPRARRVAAFAALLCLAGCTDRPRTGRAEATADTLFTAALDGRRVLVLDGFAGRVTLATDSLAMRATVRLTRRARGATRASAAGRLSRVVVTQADDADLYQVVWRTALADGASADASVTLPPGAAVVVRLRTGNVTATGLDGPLDAETGAGAVRLDRLRSPTLRLRVTTGTATATVPALAPGARWHLSLGAGDATIHVAPGASVVLVGQSAAGAVAASGLRLADVERTGGPAGERFRGRLGAGEATVRVETGAGTVAFRAAR